jgi:hypothetical protein
MFKNWKRKSRARKAAALQLSKRQMTEVDKRIEQLMAIRKNHRLTESEVEELYKLAVKRLYDQLESN